VKTNNNNKVVKARKGSKVSVTPVVDTPVVSVTPVVTPVVDTPVVTPVVSVTPIKPASVEDIGVPNLGSKRIGTTRVDTYRVVPNQRKGVIARYYVQGGFTRVDHSTNKDFFVVAVEIPHTDLYTAKLQMVKLNADLKAGSTGTLDTLSA